MIIKRVNIISFGAIKNKIIEFEKGTNIIYGQNEAGKSTIQSFIKIWLYGFSNYRGRELKSNERLKFMPVSGEVMRGELSIIHNEKEYIINRVFGKTKKDDISSIIDGLTGEEIKDILSDEPGKYFLGVNSSTFVRTLFIGQLNVEVKKDKNEEILDKISNAVGVGEGDVTIDKAFMKLETYKKSLSNIRKSGTIDKLREKYSNLAAERIEGYKLSEANLDNESRLIKLSNEKKSLKEELDNLEIYKKYLKKRKLKKEYEDIVKYLRKKEELQREEKFMDSTLTCNNEVITSVFVNEVKEEHSAYLSLLDIKGEEENSLSEKLEKVNLLKEPIKKYISLDIINENFHRDINRLKLEQEVLQEKVNINNKLQKEIEFLQEKQKEAKEVVGEAINIGDIRDDISESLKSYEDKLKELKYILELGNLDNTKALNKIAKVVFLVISLGSLLGVIFFSDFILKGVSGVTSLLFLCVYFFIINNSGKGQSKREKLLQQEIKGIEERLNIYIKKTKSKDNSELLKKVKLYDDYIDFKEKISIRINEKISQRSMLGLDEAKSVYIKNIEDINMYLETFGVVSIDDLLDKISEYKITIDSIKILEIEIKNQNERLKTIYEQIQIREEKITDYIKKLGLRDINLLDLGDKLLELNEKIIKRDEIHRELLSIDETYSALSKGKNIDVIKEELKDVIKITFNYSYETEEEIDSVVKDKTSKLLEVEKEIKDVENSINNRFKGKRGIPEIEEEITTIESKIEEGEKLLQASNLVNEVLKESYGEIRESFGPLLNENVGKAFKEFTSKRYSDVMVSDKYEMKIISGNETFSADLLSCGTSDQLYLALRLAFIRMIFKKKSFTVYLDDAFVQYDDHRVEKVLLYLINEHFAQRLIFTCQKREANILDRNNVKYRYINL